MSRVSVVVRLGSFGDRRAALPNFRVEGRCGNTLKAFFEQDCKVAPANMVHLILLNLVLLHFLLSTDYQIVEP